MRANFEYEDDENEITYYLDVSFTPVPFVPARIYGDPYDCYPAEGGYCEDIIPRVVSVYVDDTHFEDERLPAIFQERFERLFEKDEKLRRRIEEACQEAAAAASEPDPDRYRD